MSITRSTHTLIAVLATAAALVAIALTGTARAAGDPLAQERYYSSHGSPAADAALAQEQHYSSYGEPAPLSLPSAPAPDGESPWVPIIAVVAGGVLVIGATAAGLRRLRVRRRAARVLA
jgi:hypothetical protein